MNRVRIAVVGGLALLLGIAAPAQKPIVPEAEQSDVAKLPTPGARWVYVTDAFTVGGTRIVDGDSGKYMGTVHGGQLADFTPDRSGNAYYVAESIWSRGNRGKREDLLTIYDRSTLNILSEIAIPGRLLIGMRNFTLATSVDGHYGYVYNMDPASSIVVVDLLKRKYLRSVEIPGCGLVIPGPDGTTSSLCSDGSLATVSYNAKPQITHTPVFFSADQDPIFDNSYVDSKTGKALFLTYTGQIYEAQLGATPTIGQPWSIQKAAGLPQVDTKPLISSWQPGGREPIAFHRESGKAYILMHLGEYWSQKASGTEVWEVDIANRKVLRRKKIAAPARYIAISQGPSPLLYLANEEGELSIVDAGTFAEKHKLTHIGFGNLTVASN